MDKDLVVLFEAAKKAADAAAAENGGAAEESLCLDSLRELKDFPVSYQILVDTQVGKRLRHLTKHPRKKIQAFAAELIEIWKNIIIQETNQKKNGNLDKKLSDGEVRKRAISVKAQTSQPDIHKREKVEQEFSPRPTKIAKSDVSDKKLDKDNNDHSLKSELDIAKRQKVEPQKMAKSDVSVKKMDMDNNGHSVKTESGSSVQSVKTESGNSAQSVKVHTTVKLEKHPSDLKKPSSVSNGPPKFTSLIKCNDETRDNVRKIVYDALSKVSAESDVSIRDDVDACDPIRVAVTVESVLFEKWGRATGANKVKYRSIMFNLKDPKNRDFRRKVLLGHVRAENIPLLMPEEMASEERKMETKKIKEKALFECERAGAPKATTDQFKCGRCGKRETTYYQLQTRSADEPMTTFVTCANCNNHWKFC